MNAPIVETARLRLRGHRLDDFQNCARLWADPIVTRYIAGAPLSVEDSWARLLRHAGHWSLLSFGYWVAEEKATSAFVGELGFADYKRDLEPPLDDIPEAGWAFASSAHGKGYATEALQAIVSWGEGHFMSSQTACLIHPDNAPSIRVAEKCGYRESLRTSYKGKPTILFTRNR
jgi:RimJ/RimL family protein N-acetyltransferase